MKTGRQRKCWQEAWHAGHVRIVRIPTASKARRRRLQPGSATWDGAWGKAEKGHYIILTTVQEQSPKASQAVKLGRTCKMNVNAKVHFQVRKLKLSLKHLVQGHTLGKRKSSELKVSHEVPATRKQCHRQGESCPFESCSHERHLGRRPLGPLAKMLSEW